MSGRLRILLFCPPGRHLVNRGAEVALEPVAGAVELACRRHPWTAVARQYGDFFREVWAP